MKRIILAALVLAGCTITPMVNMSRYDAITDGMTYDQVVAIVGKPGKEFSRTGTGENEYVTYTWANNDGTNVTAVFVGGKMKSKAQIGLK